MSIDIKMNTYRMVGLLGGWVDGGGMRLINYGLEFV